MARTWKDQPRKLCPWCGGDWWKDWGPHRYAHLDRWEWHHHGGDHRHPKQWAARWWRAERAWVRRELHAGLEPAPSRTRHSVLWDIL